MRKNKVFPLQKNVKGTLLPNAYLYICYQWIHLIEHLIEHCQEQTTDVVIPMDLHPWTVSGCEWLQLKLQVPGRAWHWLQVNGEWESGSERQSNTTNSNWVPTLSYWKASDCWSPWLGLPNLRGWKPRSNLKNALKPKIKEFKVKPYRIIKLDAINAKKKKKKRFVN